MQVKATKKLLVVLVLHLGQLSILYFYVLNIKDNACVSLEIYCTKLLW